MLGPSLALNLPTGLYWECGCGRSDLDSFHHPGSIADCLPPQIPAMGPKIGRGMFVPTQCYCTQIGLPRFVTERVPHSLFIPQLCPTLCDLMDCSLLGSSVPEISQARILEWVAVSFSRRSSWPRDRTWVSCISRQILYHQATREVCYCTQRAEIPNCSSNTHTHIKAHFPLEDWQQEYPVLHPWPEKSPEQSSLSLTWTPQSHPWLSRSTESLQHSCPGWSRGEALSLSTYFSFASLPSQASGHWGTSVKLWCFVKCKLKTANLFRNSYFIEKWGPEVLWTADLDLKLRSPHFKPLALPIAWCCFSFISMKLYLS